MINDALFFRIFVIFLMMSFEIEEVYGSYWNIFDAWTIFCFARLSFIRFFGYKNRKIRFVSILNEREDSFFATWRNSIRAMNRVNGFEYFSLLPRGICRGWYIEEINSVTGVQISIVLINKQMYRRANICPTKAGPSTVQGFGGCSRGTLTGHVKAANYFCCNENCHWAQMKL